LEPQQFERRSEFEFLLKPEGKMRVPGVIFATEALIQDMDQKVHDQIVNVAALPGIVTASYAMPDAHWGYGFPIGGVAAFDPEQGGVISAGGVGFDISCGVRNLRTGVTLQAIEPVRERLAEELFQRVPAGVGSTGRLRLDRAEMDAMLRGGARWAVERGYGTPPDLEFIEERGAMEGADPGQVSDRAKTRQIGEVGTLGSGNHYLELQEVEEICEESLARTFGLRLGDIIVSIHCGSRGLGHQVGTDYLRLMTVEAARHGIELTDRELACAPIDSDVGRRYLGAMRAAMNCAMANRQVITHRVREAFAEVLPEARLELLYDVSHNTCKIEDHMVAGAKKRLFVHRKGATRAFGPGRAEIPAAYRESGQPVLIGGTMGTASYILAGTGRSMELAFGSSCHGAGRAMSRHQALKRWRGREVVAQLAKEGILIRCPSFRGVAEEAPGAYKNVNSVVDAAEGAGLSRKVAKLRPIICIKG
jgi:tRNA-splicing ligase RtcB